MLKLTDIHTCPPGGYRWKEQVTAKEFHAWTLPSLLASARSYLHANGLQVPVDLEALAHDYTCQNQPPGTCEDVRREIGWMAKMRMAFNTVLSGTKVLGSWAISGLPLVPQEKADARSRVCSTCHLNMPVDGCAPCAFPVLAAVVRSAIGDHRSEKHDQLNGCGACGCDLKTKVWTPLEHIVKSFTYGDMLPEACWVGKEIKEIAQ